MPLARAFARIAVTVTAGAIAVVGSVALATAPAYAADSVDVNLNSLSSQMTPGSRADSFSVRLQNKTKVEILRVQRVFTIKLAGLNPDQVRITRGFSPLPSGGSSGDVRVTDTLLERLNRDGGAADSVTTVYSIQFLQGAPGGRASFTAAALADGKTLGTDSDSVTVRGVAAPSASKTLGATGAGVVPTFDNGTPVATQPIEQATTKLSDSGVPIGLYVTGAILVIAGGVMLWLLFRRRPQPAGPDPLFPSDHDRSPSLGYPDAHSAHVAMPRHAAPANLSPTTPFPVQGARPPGIHTPPSTMAPTASLPVVPKTPPPADPWANLPHP